MHPSCKKHHIATLLAKFSFYSSEFYSSEFYSSEPRALARAVSHSHDNSEDKSTLHTKSGTVLTGIFFSDSSSNDKLGASNDATPRGLKPAAQKKKLDAQDKKLGTALMLTGLVLALAVGGFVRLYGLGARSLWLDEFCTWHVSQLPLAESFQWGPELTIPPLYQLAVRAVSDTPRPTEWELRLPAALSGIFLIGACYWLGSQLCGAGIGLALAWLIALHPMSIEYSREARPYSMLVLGCTLSTILWLRLVKSPRSITMVGYVIVTAISFYAHLLMALTVLAQLIWWLMWRLKNRHQPKSLRPLTSMALVALCCMPLAFRYLYYRSTAGTLIDWIEPPSWEKLVGLLSNVTLGPYWIGLVFAPAFIWWVYSKLHRDRVAAVETSPLNQSISFVLIWLAATWVGLVLISLTLMPLAVNRYALPAAIPALLFPLLIARKIKPVIVPVITVAFCLYAAFKLPDQLTAAPGFRELTQFVKQKIDPHENLIANVVGRSTNPYWQEMRSLALQYYPIDDRLIHEIVLDKNDDPSYDPILNNPNALYLIVFRSDPFAIAKAVGRHSEPIQVNDHSYLQLNFSPYRLVRIAPIANKTTNKD